jgi:hypothetical protein
MPKTIEELRLRFRQEDPKTAGDDGEMLARKFMTRNGWKYHDIEQDLGGLSPALKAAGGKRPDFVLETDFDREIVFIDAKQHSTDNGQTFSLTGEELVKYQALKSFSEAQFSGSTVELVFMLFPKEHVGRRLAFVGLSDFDRGTDCEINGKPARSVDISTWMHDAETGRAIMPGE